MKGVRRGCGILFLLSSRKITEFIEVLDIFHTLPFKKQTMSFQKISLFRITFFPILYVLYG